MLLEMKVPSPGESISEVEIAEWLVADGDYVEKDQSIAEIDSDKATLELPAEESGIIKIKVSSLFIKIFSIAGSSNHAVADVAPATKIEKITAKIIFLINLFV